MTHLRVTVKPTQVFDIKLLTLMTDSARMADTEFLGMGFNNNEVILTYESSPIQKTAIVKSIELLLK